MLFTKPAMKITLYVTAVIISSLFRTSYSRSSYAPKIMKMPNAPITEFIDYRNVAK